MFIKKGVTTTSTIPTTVTTTGANPTTVTNLCASSPCLNGGTCIQSGNGVICACLITWTGLFCQTAVS